MTEDGDGTFTDALSISRLFSGDTDLAGLRYAGVALGNGLCPI
jgi:hypothetical protein